TGYRANGFPCRKVALDQLLQRLDLRTHALAQRGFGRGQHRREGLTAARTVVEPWLEYPAHCRHPPPLQRRTQLTRRLGQPRTARRQRHPIHALIRISRSREIDRRYPDEGAHAIEIILRLRFEIVMDHYQRALLPEHR